MLDLLTQSGCKARQGIALRLESGNGTLHGRKLLPQEFFLGLNPDFRPFNAVINIGNLLGRPIFPS